MQRCTYVRFPCQPIRVIEKVRPTRVMNALRGELWELKSKSSQSGLKKRLNQSGLLPLSGGQKYIQPTRVREKDSANQGLWTLSGENYMSMYIQPIRVWNFFFCQPGLQTLRGGNYRRISRQPGFKKTIQPTMVMSAFRWKLWELKTKPRQSGFKKKIRPNKKSVRGEFSLPWPRGTDRNQLDPKKMFVLLHTLDTHWPSPLIILKTKVVLFRHFMILKLDKNVNLLNI